MPTHVHNKSLMRPLIFRKHGHVSPLVSFGAGLERIVSSGQLWLPSVRLAQQLNCSDVSALRTRAYL